MKNEEAILAWLYRNDLWMWHRLLLMENLKDIVKCQKYRLKCTKVIVQNPFPYIASSYVRMWSVHKWIW